MFSKRLKYITFIFVITTMTAKATSQQGSELEVCADSNPVSPRISDGTISVIDVARETELSLLELPNEVLVNVFRHLGTDEIRHQAARVCMKFRALCYDHSYLDEEVETIIAGCRSPDGMDYFSVDMLREYLAVKTIEGRRAYKASVRATYRSMEAYLASGDYLGIFNKDYFELLLKCLDLDPAMYEFTFEGRNLRQFPKETSLFKGCRILSFEANLIRRLPASFCSLVQLGWLNLNGNELSVLPVGMGSLTRLTVLFLDNNRLTEIPPVLAELPSLEVLSLENNMIKDVPVILGRMRKLISLNLSHNQIRYVTSRISQLSLLSTLYLDRNKLVVIPIGLCELQRLKTLWLSYNELIDLPAQMDQLLSLEELNLDNNRLYELPQTLRLLPLRRLSLRANKRLVIDGQYPEWIQQLLRQVNEAANAQVN